VAEPVRVRRLTDQEGQRLQQIVRRGTGSPIRLRRAMVILASAGGNTVPAIARLVQGDEDAVRQVIHRFNEMGLGCLDPQWAGGRPRQISDDDEAFIVATANTRPEALGQPFTRWSLRKLADYLAHNPGCRRVTVGRERLRQLLHKHSITFQRTKTWKESTDPQREAKLARIEHVTAHFPDRVFAFDEFGPLTIRPQPGAGWAPAGRPDRLPANYRKPHGVRQLHACYSVGDDTLWGVVRRRKSAANTLAALKSIRKARPDGAPIYVILDNLSAHRGAKIRAWAAANKVELCSPRPTRRGPTRSRRTSGRCAASSSPAPTTPTTWCWPVRCTTTCAGATPTPATPTSSPPNAANAPACVANANAAGANPPPALPDRLAGQGPLVRHRRLDPAVDRPAGGARPAPETGCIPPAAR
jgi:transposase